MACKSTISWSHATFIKVMGIFFKSLSLRKYIIDQNERLGNLKTVIEVFGIKTYPGDVHLTSLYWYSYYTISHTTIYKDIWLVYIDAKKKTIFEVSVSILSVAL